MAILPEESLALLDCSAPVFTRPTYQRFLVLLGAAIITTGRRTVANLLRTAGSLAPGHVSSYRRVFSKARWSMLRLACALTRHVVSLLPADGPIVLAGDDTVIAHPGRTSTARPATATPFVRHTPSPPGGMATSGSCSPSSSASHSPTAPGPCRSLSPCTTPREPTAGNGIATALRLSTCSGCSG